MREKKRYTTEQKLIISRELLENGASISQLQAGKTCPYILIEILRQHLLIIFHRSYSFQMFAVLMTLAGKFKSLVMPARITGVTDTNAFSSLSKNLRVVYFSAHDFKQEEHL